MTKERLDVFLTKQNHFTSREKAKRGIAEGQVVINGMIATQSKQLVDESDEIVLNTPKEAFVGRGAYKLKHALDTFGLSLVDKLVLDIGASTGGFTQVALAYGARQVYALDVGSNQLDPLLRNDPRVVVMEHRNFRYAQADWFDQRLDFVCCDVSFISLQHIIPSLIHATHDLSEFVFLIKPQFEAGKDYLNKHGVVTSKSAHKRVIYDIMEALRHHGITTLHVTHSPITGKDGNIEYLLHGAKQAPAVVIDVAKLIDSK